MEKTELYRERVWEFLNKMQPGQRFKVASQCRPENRELFVWAIKRYMDYYGYECGVMFNKDFSEFYKIHSVDKPKNKAKQ